MKNPDRLYELLPVVHRLRSAVPAAFHGSHGLSRAAANPTAGTFAAGCRGRSPPPAGFVRLV